MVPAYTEVIDMLKFKGARAPPTWSTSSVDRRRPRDARRDDVPPANDLRVKRFDISGSSTNEQTLGERAGHQHLREAGHGAGRRASSSPPPRTASRSTSRRSARLAGPLELQPGEKVRERVADKYRTRFFGSVRAYLVPLNGRGERHRTQDDSGCAEVLVDSETAGFPAPRGSGGMTA